MPSITLKPGKYPVGATVSVYLRSQKNVTNPTSGVPSGSAVTTAVVAADNSVTFPGLLDDVDYFAYHATYGIVDFSTRNPRKEKIRFGGPQAYSDVHRRAWGPGGALAATTDRDDATADLAATASGTLLLVGGAVLPAGETVSRVGFVSGATALGTGTHQWFGIYRQDTRALLAVTSNDTNAAWAGNTVKELALTAPYTPQEDLPVYLGILVAATTPPSLRGSNLGNAIVSSMLTAPILAGTSNTGLTTPQAIGTIATAITAGSIQPLAWAR